MDTDQNETDFDEERYLVTCQDVARSVQAGEVAAALRQCTVHRRDEGRKPRPGFDPASDGTTYPVVTAKIGSGEPETWEHHDRPGKVARLFFRHGDSMLNLHGS